MSDAPFFSASAIIAAAISANEGSSESSCAADGRDFGASVLSVRVRARAVRAFALATVESSDPHRSSHLLRHAIARPACQNQRFDPWYRQVCPDPDGLYARPLSAGLVVDGQVRRADTEFIA